MTAMQNSYKHNIIDQDQLNPVSGLIVLMTDFGLKDGTVNELKGVIYAVNKSLIISDLTHEIKAFDIFEAAYRLYQVAPYWPAGTIFVSVVDPGVGTERKSIILKSKTGLYFISPDNGILTFVNQMFGSEKIIEINENDHLLPNTNSSTSHGRDLYAYLAAKLASNSIKFDDIGVTLSTELVQFSYKEPIIDNDQLIGSIQIHDGYGNIWTNIRLDLVNQYYLDTEKMYRVEIFCNSHKYYDKVIAFCKTYDDVAIGEDLLYINSVSCLAFGINQSNFTKHYNIGCGYDWHVKISR